MGVSENAQNNEQNPTHYEISFLLVTYNSSFERIKKTLVSYLEQKDVSFEIIVTDDGSENNHSDEIERLFAEYGFKDYKLVMNKVNRGIVKNHNAGIAVAEGEYIRTLGPGDYLHDDRIIRDWIDFLKASDSEWSISEAIYYDKDTGIPISVPAHPQDMKPYRSNLYIDKSENSQKRKTVDYRIRWNYTVLNDIALGAVMLGRTRPYKEYSQRIEAKGIKYAEDNMWRLMMFDGIVPSYYSDRPTVYYEYGGGISTSGSNFWSDRIREDWLKTNELMCESENTDDFQKEMLRNMNEKNFFKKIFIKGKLMHIIKTKFMPRKTVVV